MKNLEIEYKKLTEENVPDLWDRIEAGIDKLEADKNIIGTNNYVNNEEVTKKVVSINKKKTVNRIVPIIVAAAAIALSFGLFMMSNSRSLKTADSATAERPYYDAAADVAEENAYNDYADSDVSENTNNIAADAMDEAAAEVVEEAVPADVGIGAAEKEDIDTIEYYGIVTVCDNPEFIEIMMDDGSARRIYLPTEYQEAILSRAEENMEIHIIYELVDSELIESFPEAYQDVNYQVKEYLK